MRGCAEAAYVTCLMGGASVIPSSDRVSTKRNFDIFGTIVDTLSHIHSNDKKRMCD